MGKITIDSKDLLNEVKLLLPITQKTIIPICEMIRFRSINEDEIELTANNSQISFHRIVEASNSGDILICLPAKDLHDLLSKCPSLPLNILTQGVVANIKTQIGDYEIVGDPAEEFIEDTDFSLVSAVQLDSQLFSKKLSNVLTFAVSNDSKPATDVVRFELKKSELTLIGFGLGNSSVLGISKLEAEITDSICFSIKKASASIIAKSINSTNIINLHYSNASICIEFENSRIFCPKIDIKFPLWKPLIISNAQKIVLNRKDLIGSIDRVSVFSSSGHIEMSFNESQLTLKGERDMKLGEAVEVIEIDSDVKLDIVFSAKYFLPCLKSIEGDEFCLFVKNEKTGVLIEGESGNEQRILMPYYVPE